MKFTQLLVVVLCTMVVWGDDLSAEAIAEQHRNSMLVGDDSHLCTVKTQYRQQRARQRSAIAKLSGIGTSVRGKTIETALEELFKTMAQEKAKLDELPAGDNGLPVIDMRSEGAVTTVMAVWSNTPFVAEFVAQLPEVHGFIAPNATRVALYEHGVHFCEKTEFVPDYDLRFLRVVRKSLRGQPLLPKEASKILPMVYGDVGGDLKQELDRQEEKKRPKEKRSRSHQRRGPRMSKKK